MTCDLLTVWTIISSPKPIHY